MNHFNLWAGALCFNAAKWYNAMQKYAEESTRLGIPITIASDPRNHFSGNIFAMAATDFSQWCEPLGFAAIGDEKLMWQFADMCDRNMWQPGFGKRLHPMADLATEPRWPRISGTFGEDAQLSAKLTKAYIFGFQGNKLGLRVWHDDKTFFRWRSAKRRT